MKQLETIFTRACRVGIGLAFLVLIVAVLTQVIARSISASPIWTEELTRFAMLFMIAFGAGLSFRSGDLVNVDVVCEALPGAWPRRLRIVSAMATAALCAVLILPAWKFVSIGAFQTSPAMQVQMTYVHLSVLVLLVILAIFAVLRVLRMIFDGHDGRPTPQGEME